ncbi:MAG TPA: type I-B CRISPR-associated endonuclease Cas1b [Balneolales bacterium]|nr:type I-B CRISPR-associated endonuclease Cas1b [Balneolales bacterium]
MNKTFYLFNPGRLSRKDQTLKFTPVDQEGNEGRPKYLPIEGIADLYCFGSLDANSALYNFLGKQGIAVHFFDYYEYYSGSFMPKDYLLAGKMQVQQALSFHEPDKRQKIAQKFIEGAAHNILKNLRYYQQRDRDLEAQITAIESLSEEIPNSKDIPELMGVEGNIRQVYYQAFDEIISDFEMNGRTKQPPKNEVNTLISFGNMMCYTACLSQIYHTQLNPTISFLHDPGTRRYSLALDLAEIFKPIIVDRTIFRVLNKHELTKDDFDVRTNRCTLKEGGKKTFIKAFEERLGETIKHRKLGRSVSYKRLIRLECYKLTKHILNIEDYEPFKMWW